MQQRTRRFRHIGARALVVAAFGLALTLLVSSSPALARDGHGRHGVRHGRHHGNHHRHHTKYYRPHRAHHRSGLVRHAVRFAVPYRIYTYSRPQYRSHYRGRVYYRPHRHDHAVYMFPVSTPYGVVYRPHAYCGDRLFVGGVIDLGAVRLDVRMGF